MPTPPLVLLHGVGLDATMWAPVRALLEDDFEVLAPDLPGHGTRPPVGEGTTLGDLAAAVAADLQPGSHVVGFSLGALVGQHLARHRPDLVSTLTSVASVCMRTEAERAAVLDRLATAATDFRAGVTASLERWFAGTGTDAGIVRATEATLLANDVDSYLSCYRVFATADAEIAPELPRITVPALAVTGADDPGSTPEMTHRLAAAMPDCRAVVVPGARHMLPVQRPRDLVTCLTTFIRERAHV